MQSLALIGYRATGKTTVGKILAEELGQQFIDTDAVIVQRAGKSIAEIFSEQSEVGFRDLESQVIDDLTKSEDTVLSLGGGAILREENRGWIQARCTPVVWLQASIETIDQRINGDAASRAQRPNLTSQGGIEEIRSILDKRTPLYEATSTLIVDTEGRAPSEIAQEILAHLRSAG